MERTKWFQSLARYITIAQSPNATEKMLQKAEDGINHLLDMLPAGSGIGVTVLELDSSKKDYIYLTSAYHVMDDNGMYLGWVRFYITLTPSLVYLCKMKVEIDEDDWEDIGEKEEDKWMIEDYLFDTFDEIIMEDVCLLY